MLIYVNTEEEKLNLLRESEYLHNFVDVIKLKTKDGKIKPKIISLESDKASTIMHIYTRPDLIIVRKKL